MTSSSNGERYGNIVEANLEDLASALQNGTISSVDLVAKYLRRISKYDCKGPSLNSIPLLNSTVFEEAVASDDRRRLNDVRGLLDGIPYTVKDSYKVRGMTVASGSPAFQNLKSNEDAFTVGKLREAGAVLIGKTNMCPMAYGGMQRGVYGRAESPYNKDYLAAAFASGSSNGSGASTGASLAAFGMGEETVSSGRSPASNNGLIAYTPSRGLISIRGNWPLYPTCDVVVPHTRSMADLFHLLDVVTAEDENTRGDFWRDQPFIKIPNVCLNKPISFTSITEGASLQGLRIAVPELYIGGQQLSDGLPVVTSKSVQSLWQQARKELEAAGATVVAVQDFPVIRVYENPQSNPQPQRMEQSRLPPDWNTTERRSLIAHAWQDFLDANHDTEISSISSVDATQIFPQVPPDHPQIKYSEPANAVPFTKLVSYLSPDAKYHAEKPPLYDIPNLGVAVKALESMRKLLFEDWLDENEFDCVVFPAAGDVGSADADVNDESAQYAWRNGVKYSNGNRALRHLGVPSVTVPMGMIEDKNMPMGLTFLGKAYDDTKLMKLAYAYEQISRRRIAPPLTPQLATAALASGPQVDFSSDVSRPLLQVTECSGVVDSGDHNIAMISIKGQMMISLPKVYTGEVRPVLDIYIDGELVSPAAIQISPSSASKRSTTTSKEEHTFMFACNSSAIMPLVQDERNRVTAKIARDSTMIVVLARAAIDVPTALSVTNLQADTFAGKPMTNPSGCLGLIHRSEFQNA